MKNFPCDILRNNVEIGWYRANAGPIQAGQCWADTIGPMLGRYNRANAGPIPATTSTFITVCPVHWLSTVCTVAGTNGTRQYNASIGPILVCLLGITRIYCVAGTLVIRTDME